MAELTFLERIRSIIPLISGGAATQSDGVEERARPRKEEDTPRGIVFTGGVIDRASLRSMMRQADRPRTAEELRAAARLPLVEAIIRTITRDVLSCSLDVSFISGVDATPRNVEILEQFKRVLYWPKDGETWRTAVSKVVRSSLVVGCSDVEFLRRRGGRSADVIRSALASGIDDVGALAGAIRKASKERGDIMGWAIYDSANIKADMDQHGMYRNPAFYDFGTPVDGKSFDQLDKGGAVASWDKRDFVRMLHNPYTEASLYGRGQSPVEAAWAIIDIIFHLFWRYREDLLNPVSKKMVSFTVPGTTELSPEQVTDIVETMRADIHAGRLPVLEGLDVSVHDLRSAIGQEELLSPLEQFQVILWTIFGAGLIEMGKTETATRSTAEQQVQLSRRQAVGNIKVMLIDELIGAFLNDPYSPYDILTVKLLESDLPVSRSELMSDILIPLMNMGLPVGIVLQRYFPELWSMCEQYGIADPLTMSPTKENNGKDSAGEGEQPTEKQQRAIADMIRSLVGEF